jgi:hypothetical protein
MKYIWGCIFIVALGCSEARFIGGYDARVDDGIESILREVTGIFVELDNRIDNQEDWSYAQFKDAYLKIDRDLRALRIRVNGLSQYGIIKDQLDLLEQSIGKLAKDHQLGFVAPGVTDITQLKNSIEVDEKAISVSLSSMLALQDELKRKKQGTVSAR